VFSSLCEHTWDIMINRARSHQCPQKVESQASLKIGIHQLSDRDKSVYVIFVEAPIGVDEPGAFFIYDLQGKYVTSVPSPEILNFLVKTKLRAVGECTRSHIYEIPDAVTRLNYEFCGASL